MACFRDLAVWARELQKYVEAEEANHGLTLEDLKFLADLGIGQGGEE